MHPTRQQSQHKIIKSFLFLFLLFSTPLFAQSISELYKQEKALDQKIVKALRFTLDPDQPELGGTNEKVLVRDQLGRRWLFKIHQSQEQDVVSVVASDVAHLTLIRVPQTYAVSFVINGRKTPGTLLRWIDEAKNLKKIPPQMLGQDQINQILHQQLLDYLLVNFDIQDDNFLLQKKTGEIFGIDKDYAFDYWDEDFPLALKSSAETMYYEDYYMKTWKAYIEERKDVDFASLLELLAYIEQSDESLLRQMVQPVFRFARVKNHVGSIEDFLNRKKGMKDQFLGLYQAALDERGETDVTLELPSAEAYQQKVIQAYETRMAIKKEELKKLEENSVGKQAPFELVYNQKAWSFLSDNQQKGPSFLLNGLEKILRQTTNPNERRAVELYREQIQKWNPQKPMNWDLRYVVRLPKR